MALTQGKFLPPSVLQKVFPAVEKNVTDKNLCFFVILFTKFSCITYKKECHVFVIYQFKFGIPFRCCFFLLGSSAMDILTVCGRNVLQYAVQYVSRQRLHYMLNRIMQYPCKIDNTPWHTDVSY